MNKIGGKYFSPEWFDLDRSGKMKVVMKINYSIRRRYVDRDSTGFIEERYVIDKYSDEFEIKENQHEEFEHWKLMHPDAEIDTYSVNYLIQ